jgi:hypothetical protein
MATECKPIDFFHADCLPIEPEHFTQRPEGQLAKTGAAVEKLLSAKFEKIKSRQRVRRMPYKRLFEFSSTLSILHILAIRP